MRCLILALLLAGCRQLLGFEDPVVVTPGDGPAPDTSDAPIGCSGDPSSCPAATPICFQEICVECTQADTSACSDAEPFCGIDNRCRGCISNDDCASELCLADGTCATATDVAYVDSTGSDTLCTQAQPCTQVDQGFSTGRPFIKVSGVVAEAIGGNLNRSVEIYGTPGSAITRPGGQLFDINNNADVRLFGVHIRDTAGGHAIRVNNGTLLVDASLIANNGGLGVNARNGTTVTLRRSIFFNNAQGGADLDNAIFTITNCMFVKNGSLTSSLGGMRLKPETRSSNTFELVTVADNLIDSASGNESGVRCDQPFEAHSSIVTGNTLDAACTFHDSLFDSATVGTGNKAGDPDFINTTDPTSLDFYRIGPSSDAIDSAVSTIPFDIDGAARPTGAGPDMGADERP